MKKDYWITYDSAKEKAFLIHTEDVIVKFKKNDMGLHNYEFPKEFINKIKDMNRKEEVQFIHHNNLKEQNKQENYIITLVHLW